MRMIDADAAIDEINKYGSIWMEYTEGMTKDKIAEEALKNAKASMKRIINELPSAQPKKGKWEEREVLQTADVGEVELQSARCSACGLYHTTPYMYYFSNYKYCPNCGADMRGEGDVDDD